MNQPFETELTSYRIDWRANLINNEYHYIGGDRYNNNETTRIIGNTPEWYNTDLVDNHIYYQNNNTILWKLFEVNHQDNIQGNIQYNSHNEINYDNTSNNWIISDGTLHTHFVIVTNELNENTLNTHLNLIREHYHYDNVNEVINNIRTELLQYINIDG